MTTETKKIAIMPCLWFDKNAEEAAKFYARTFPNSRVTAVHKSPSDYHNGKAGNVLTVEFTVLGQPFVGLNGGPGVPLYGRGLVPGVHRYAGGNRPLLERDREGRGTRDRLRLLQGQIWTQLADCAAGVDGGDLCP